MAQCVIFLLMLILYSWVCNDLVFILANKRNYPKIFVNKINAVHFDVCKNKVKPIKFAFCE